MARIDLVCTFQASAVRRWFCTVIKLLHLLMLSTLHKQRPFMAHVVGP